MYLGGAGWRARIGLIVPSVNTVLEPLYYQIAPPGVSFHTARMLMPPRMTKESIEEMDRHTLRAAQEVASARVDVIAHCCTASSIVKGPEHDRAVLAEIEQETGIPTTTAMDAIIRALHVFGARRIAVASPYPHEIDEREVAFFAECGIDVLNIVSLGISGGVELADPAPDEIYRFARSAYVPGTEALFISCLNFRSHDAIAALEDDLGVPVVTSPQAVLWNALRLAGLRARVEGYGRLLTMPDAQPGPREPLPQVKRTPHPAIAH